MMRRGEREGRGPHWTLLSTAWGSSARSLCFYALNYQSRIKLSLSSERGAALAHNTQHTSDTSDDRRVRASCTSLCFKHQKRANGWRRGER